MLYGHPAPAQTPAPDNHSTGTGSPAASADPSRTSPADAHSLSPSPAASHSHVLMICARRACWQSYNGSPDPAPRSAHRTGPPPQDKPPRPVSCDSRRFLRKLFSAADSQYWRFSSIFPIPPRCPRRRLPYRSPATVCTARTRHQRYP